MGEKAVRHGKETRHHERGDTCQSKRPRREPPICLWRPWSLACIGHRSPQTDEDRQKLQGYGILYAVLGEVEWVASRVATRSKLEARVFDQTGRCLVKKGLNNV